MRYGPWPRKRPVAAAFFLFLPPSCAVPILADKAMSRVRWRTERREACPGRGPARITLRVLRRKKKRRRNRQPPAAARGRPLLWCPAATAGGQGKEHATRHWCPTAHSPASKRPFVQPRSAATDEGCGGTLPPRCPPAHARASSGTRVRRQSPRHAQGLRPRSASTEACLARHTAFAGGQTTGVVLLVGAARMGLDAGALWHYSAKPCKEGGKPQRGKRRPSRPAYCGGRRPRLEDAQIGAESHPRNRQKRHSRLSLGARERLAEPPHEGGE